MEFDEIADKAYRRIELDEYANLPTKYAYLKLKNLYDEFKNGEISKENCVPIKQKIKREYENNLLEYNRDMEIYKEYNQNRNENEVLIIDINKSNDKNEILKKCLKIIENCLKDSSFSSRILEKFTE